MAYPQIRVAGYPVIPVLNWNLQILFLEEGVKLKKKILRKNESQQQTQSTQVWDLDQATLNAPG